MSHISKIAVQIKSLHALRQACKRNGWNLQEGKRKFKAYNDGHCDHAISVGEGSYEIGVVGNKDGSFHLEWDTWQGGRGLVDAVGNDCGKLKQSYSLEAAKIAANKQGYSFYEQRKQDGSVDLVINC